MTAQPARRTPRCLAAGLLLAAPVAASAAAVSPAGAEPSGTALNAALLAGYLGGAIVLSFLCSIAESVLLSITPSFIEDQRDKRPQLAAMLRRLRLESVDQSLAAILTLNTIAHTVGAVGSGAQATLVFGSAWVGAFSAVATLLILFLSEIVPKTLGAVHWRALAGPVAGFVRVLIVVLYPLIRISELLTRMVSRGKQTHVFSRDEFIAMAGVGEKAGHIDPRESRILRNLFRMSSLKARDVMTPRPVLAGMQRDARVSEALKAGRTAPFSRIPLYTENRDDIDGFVLKDELLQAEARGEGSAPLHRLKRELLSVPDSMPLSNLLEFLLDRRQQIALVVGEYGDVQGLVTMEDVVETLLGDEIVDEMDRDTDMQRLARERWEKRASARGLRLPDPGDDR
ncbi:HlyC/CorC family transporter [Luteimonas sp. SJ-92]|uniref:HlyC/CorC family transporter n=1 Tax=Luteimonas salinisoli TaxID=2752307 RepID=A0A853J7L1_9GAMM|nr:hemolysin family protein [Luteimonas salinisoli]NZA25126.1 HlyC/CorC family transporter [Luteimonas salinisoli]